MTTRRLMALLLITVLLFGYAAGFLAGRASAPRPAVQADLPRPLGRMTTEVSLPSPDSARLAEAPTAAPPSAPDRAASLTPAVVAVPAATAGTATWYCLPGRSACTRGYPAGGMYAAAGPALRVGNWRGRTVLVSAGGRHVAVRLIDACACGGGRVIDLYAAAFSRLAPLSRGTVAVTVRTIPEPPPTSTAR